MKPARHLPRAAKIRWAIVRRPHRRTPNQRTASSHQGRIARAGPCNCCSSRRRPVAVALRPHRKVAPADSRSIRASVLPRRRPGYALGRQPPAETGGRAPIQRGVHSDRDPTAVAAAATQPTCANPRRARPTRAGPTRPWRGPIVVRISHRRPSIEIPRRSGTGHGSDAERRATLPANRARRLRVQPIPSRSASASRSSSRRPVRGPTWKGPGPKTRCPPPHCCGTRPKAATGPRERGAPMETPMSAKGS